jgi:cellulose synthase operon protein C
VREALPDDVLSLARLARLYAEAGDPRAQDFARRAYRLAPGSAEARDALGWLLVRSGKFQEGLALLEQAHATAPEDPTLSYHYAFALARVGETGRASVLLQGLLARPEGFECRDAARRLLQKLDRS